MWCSTCQQDIPALGSPSSGGELRCGKCGGTLATAQQLTITDRTSDSNFSIAAAKPTENAAFEKLVRCPPLPEDDWTLEAELRGVQRLLSSLKSRQTSTESMSLHLPESALPPWHATTVTAPASGDLIEPSTSAADQPRANTLAWTIVSVSLAIFACGAVLLIWSLLGQREDLWSLGLPLTLIGQAGLILGLVLQIDGLTGRRAAENRPPMHSRASRGIHTAAIPPSSAHRS